MTPDFFYSTDHVAQYLCDSVIKIKKIPCIVLEVDKIKGHYKIYYKPTFNDLLDNSKSLSINLDDEDVDLSPIELGYFNIKRFDRFKTARVFRKPIRGWKIGLCPSNLVVLDYNNRGDTESLLYSYSMFQLMTNNFPSFEEALEIIKKDTFNNIAFSRKFELKGRNIHYSLIDEPIGTIINDNNVSLLPEYNYLLEEFEEVINNESK